MKIIKNTVNTLFNGIGKNRKSEENKSAEACHQNRSIRTIDSNNTIKLRNDFDVNPVGNRSLKEIKDIYKVKMVSVGEYQISSDKKTLLYTKDLSDCTAVAVMYNKNKKTGLYTQRTLIHINGSNIESGLLGKKSDASQIIEQLANNVEKSGDGKIVVAFGKYNSSEFSKTLILGQSKNLTSTEKPLLELLSKSSDVHMGLSTSLSISPYGEFSYDQSNYEYSNDEVSKFIQNSQ